MNDCTTVWNTHICGVEAFERRTGVAIVNQAPLFACGGKIGSLAIQAAIEAIPVARGCPTTWMLKRDNVFLSSRGEAG